MSLDLSKYEGHTPGKWVWGDGWDHPDLESFNNDPNANWPEKYMDMGLHGAKEKVVIPIRVDHREMIWDGDLLNPSDRALIADAPQLLAELREYTRFMVRVSDGWYDRERIIEMSKLILQGKTFEQAESETE